MRKLILKNETDWVEIIPVSLTDEQKILIKSRAVEDKVAREALQLQVDTDSEIVISDDVLLQFLTSKYETLKPILVSEDLVNNIPVTIYQFLSFTVLINDNDIYSGLLNYRISGEHKQIRF